jgi:K+-sensing histidine kinase KdpD
MTTDRLLLRHRGLVLALAVLAPALLCALLSLSPTAIEHTTAALLVVLLVVGAASTGLRAAGLLAAMSGALSFDFFLTAPYLTLRILDPADIEIAIGLLLVGVAITELALWGRRQQARASEQSGYLDGVLEAAAQVGAGSAPPTAVLEHVERQLITILDLDVARFHPEIDGDLPRLDADGRVRVDERALDVDRTGLPTDTELSLPVRVGRRTCGEFRLTAATHVARPTSEQRRVAVLLADQAGLALSYERR